jgi:hypothetical protein
MIVNVNVNVIPDEEVGSGDDSEENSYAVQYELGVTI